jgi:hypothetical protein
MIKGDCLSNAHRSTIQATPLTELGNSDKWAQYEVVILDKNKIYHKFSWQVEKYEGGWCPLNDCWLTTMVSSPIPLRQFNLIIHRYNFVSLFQKI